MALGAPNFLKLPISHALSVTGAPTNANPAFGPAEQRGMLGISRLGGYESIPNDSDTLKKILDFCLGSDRILSRIRQDLTRIRHSQPARRVWPDSQPDGWPGRPAAAGPGPRWGAVYVYVSFYFCLRPSRRPRARALAPGGGGRLRLLFIYFLPEGQPAAAGPGPGPWWGAVYVNVLFYILPEGQPAAAGPGLNYLIYY